jgi:hypothetical protein
VRLKRQYNTPVTQVVIFLQQSSDPIAFTEEYTDEFTSHRYQVIRLWEQDSALFLNNPALLPLAPLTRTDSPAALLSQVAQIQQWAALAPDECAITDRDYRFKIKILPKVEKCSFDNPWRSVTSENLTWRLHVAEDVILRQLNFVLLTVLHRCSDRQFNINFTFTELGAIATICNGLRSKPHPVIAALDAYIQLLEF